MRKGGSKRKLKIKSLDDLNIFIQKKDIVNLKSALRALGKIDKDEDDTVFFKIFKEVDDAETRYLAAKNIGKVLKTENLKKVSILVSSETNTEVLRELYSAIGRLRVEENIPFLIQGLDSEDPKIVMQCIRGLLVHKKNSEVYKALEGMRKHKNEMIQDIISNELSKELRKKNTTDYTFVNPSLKNKYILGDSLSILKKIPSETFHLTFTSPPYYNAKDYSFYSSYEEYLDFLTSIVKEIHRTTKEGAFFVLNTSPVIIPRFSREYSSKRYLIPYDIHPRISNIGFDFIEEIIWKKPEASAPNRNGGFFQQRKPLAYKANHCTESVVVYRKKTSKLIDWNISQYPKEVVEASKVRGKYFRSNVWEISPASSSHHPAIFPQLLADNVIQLYSMRGDLVLDPFSGICTVAKSCVENGRYFTMLEKEAKYLEYGVNMIKDIFTESALIKEDELNL